MSGEAGNAPTVMRIPPKDSRVIRKPPAKGRRLGTRRTTKHPPEIDPGPVLSWRRLGCVAALLLVAVVSTILLFVWLYDEEDGPKPLAHPGGAVDGEVTVVDGEVTVADSDVNRVPAEPER